jgi:diguanylate cyclase (GGDEF)-like protein/PAS domain S-box-containing protein
MKPQKLLVIEDSPDIHELVRLGLVGENLEFCAALSGEQGLLMAAEKSPDLILLDVELPGLNGFEICRLLKADDLTAETPVVFLTGASSTEEKLRGLELGAIDYITKPFDPAELRARVRAALNTKRLMNLLGQKAITLQQSEERFRVLAENSSDVISRYRADGVYLYVSPASIAMLGFTPDELIGRRLGDFVHPDDAAAVEQCFNARRAAGETGTVAFRFRKRNEQYVWLESTCRSLTNADGTVREVHASARDVTSRKQMEHREQVRAEVLEMITCGRPLSEILPCLTAAAEREEPDAIAAGIMLSGGIVYHCAPNLPLDISTCVERHLYELVARFAALGARSAERIVTCDLLEDPAWQELRPALLKHGLLSCWSILIRSSHRDSVGAFTLYRRDRVEPGESMIKMLKLASDLTSIAVEHRELTDQLTFQAQNDALTSLPNRTLFTDRLQHALSISARAGRPVGVLLIDVDRFKQVNDTYGHQAGDEMLCQVAHRLSERLRACDTLARMGGDEFAVVLGDLADRSDAETVAKCLVEEFKRPIQLSDRELFVTLSIGAATYPVDGTEPSTLLQHADLALYRAKDAGRNMARVFKPEMSTGAAERMELEGALRQAVSRGELRLHYQPKVDLNGRIVGLEALVRWQHPTLGLVPPAKFIPVAEDTGLILQIGAWVFTEAARQARTWADAGLRVIPISVNVSTIQFAQPDFILTISSALETCGLAEHWLDIELTETLLMRNMRDAVDKLARLKDLSVRVAIDDFGTGYSSLAYLQRLSLDTLKIDPSFVRSIDSPKTGSGGRKIIGAIVALGKSLGLQVIAEGVETEIQRRFLLDIGCDLMQGYLFSAPKPAMEIEPLLWKGIDLQPPVLAIPA